MTEVGACVPAHVLTLPSFVGDVSRYYAECALIGHALTQFALTERETSWFSPSDTESTVLVELS